MNVNNIQSILQNFEKEKSADKNAINTILINGSWGIGKTYQINDYIKKSQEKKDSKVLHFYISLFGKTGINHLEQELYKKISPLRNFFVNVTNIFSGLINDAVITAALPKGFEISASKLLPKKTKKLVKNLENIIIYIDDIERKNSNILMEELFGFINKLVNLKAKVVLICDMSRFTSIDKQTANISDIDISILNDYKEKLIDKIYNISESNEDTIKSLLDEVSNYYNKDLNEIYDNNLRHVIKSKRFFTKCKLILDKHKTANNEKNYNRILSTLLDWCSIVVVETEASTYSKLYIKREEEKAQKENTNGAINMSIFDSIFYESKLAGIKKFSSQTTAIRDSFNNLANNDSRLIDALLSIYQEENYSLFENYCEEELYEKEIPIKNIDFLFLSDEGKEAKAESIYKTLLNEELSYDAASGYAFHLLNVCKKYNLKLQINLDKVVDVVVAAAVKEVDYNDYINLNLSHNIYDLQIFIKDIYDRIKINVTKEFINNMKKLFEQKDYALFYFIVKHNILNDNSFNSPLIEADIKDVFIKNDFFCLPPEAQIDPLLWQHYQLICQLVKTKYSDKKDLLIKLFIKYKNDYADDKSLQSRLDYFLNELNK